MLHLLSPARKPMQVTQDLNSFWQTTYHDVKKELRGKYKRHYWPDDPFTAQATSKTKKQMNREQENRTYSLSAMDANSSCFQMTGAGIMG
jgi:hypothetical protein